MSESVQIVTPVGRIVQGDVWEPQTKDKSGNQLTVKKGPNAGTARVSFFIAVAIPKTDAGWDELWSKIHGTARRDFPGLFDANGNCTHPKFAFKVTDGDSTEYDEGTPPRRHCDKVGHPGHWVLKFSNGFATKAVFKDETGKYRETINPADVKRGDYVRVIAAIKGNDDSSKPGVYLNHYAVDRCGFGEAIVYGPDVNKIFSETPVGVLPAGASATPVASSAPPLAAPGTAAPLSVQQTAAGSRPVPGPMGTPPPAMSPAGVVAPAPDFLNPPAVIDGQAVPGVPAAGTAAPPPPVTVAAVEPQYTGPDGVSYTATQLAAAGWTAEAIQALPRQF